MSDLCHRNCGLPRTTAKVQKAVCWSKPWNIALIEYLIWWFVISLTVTKSKSNHPDVSQQSHWQPWCWLHSGPVRGFIKCASQTMNRCPCHITMIGWLTTRYSGLESPIFKFEAKQKVKRGNDDEVDEETTLYCTWLDFEYWAGVMNFIAVEKGGKSLILKLPCNFWCPRVFQIDFVTLHSA